MLELQQIDFKKMVADIKIEVEFETRDNNTGSHVKNAEIVKSATFSVFGKKIKRRIEGRTRHYFIKKCGT